MPREAAEDALPVVGVDGTDVTRDRALPIRPRALPLRHDIVRILLGKPIFAPH